jgi:hypothetical protein
VLSSAATLAHAGFQASSILGRSPRPGLGEAMGLVLAGLPPALYVILPAIAGIAAGLIRPTARARRKGAEVLVAVGLAMIVLDLVPGAAAAPVGGGPAITAEGQIVARPRQPTFAETGMIRTAGAAARGELRGVSERASTYPVGHPRSTAARAVLKVGLLLMTPILIGIVLGVNGWMAARVTFRSPLDERIHRLAVAWVVAPLTFWLIFRLSDSARFAVLFQQQVLLFILWPHALFIVLGAAGWERAGRQPIPAAGIGTNDDTERDPDRLAQA